METRRMSDAGSPDHMTRQKTPYLGIRFRCCGVYSKIRLNRDGTAFAGHCPRCAAPIMISVSPSGSSDRFWEAG